MAEKKKRGRPIGRGKFVETDVLLLRTFAKERVRNEHLVFTKYIRKLGVDGISAEKRLQRRWREQKSEHLATARAELALKKRGDIPALIWLLKSAYEDHITELSLSDSFTRFVEGFDSFNQAVSDLKQNPELIPIPFDATEPAAIAKAVGRLESRDREQGDSIREKEEQDKPLTDGERTYLMAVILHELAVNTLEQEASADAE